MQLPRTISNPYIGDVVTFVKTTAETNGAYVLIDVTLATGGGNGLHYHTDYVETFEVLDGTLGVAFPNSNILLQKGDVAKIDAGTVHRFYNASDLQPVKFRCTIMPAKQFEVFLRIAYGLAADGKVNRKGFPNLAYLALIFEVAGTYKPGIPLLLQKAMFGIIAFIARLLGYHKHLYKYYSAAERY